MIAQVNLIDGFFINGLRFHVWADAQLVAQQFFQIVIGLNDFARTPSLCIIAHEQAHAAFIIFVHADQRVNGFFDVFVLPLFDFFLQLLIRMRNIFFFVEGTHTRHPKVILLGVFHIESLQEGAVVNR